MIDVSEIRERGKHNVQVDKNEIHVPEPVLTPPCRQGPWLSYNQMTSLHFPTGTLLDEEPDYPIVSIK